MRDPVACSVHGCMFVARASGLCVYHEPSVWRAQRTVKPRRAKLPKGKFRTGHGYVMLWTEPRFPGSAPYGAGWAILEHRLVMGEVIGRALFADEQARHINRVRDDNAPSNLELLLDGKPAVDQLAWARKIVARYGRMFDTVEAE